MLHNRRLFVLLSLLLLMACQSIPQKEPWLAPGLLNSQRIELKFGSYAVEILAQNESFRLANLYSAHQGQKSTRTLAYTRYQLPMDESLLSAHQEIVAGGSIGSTLKKHGFTVKKSIFFIDEIDQLKTQAFFTKNRLPAVIYDLTVAKDNKVLPYCTILEIYDPKFLSFFEAQKLYHESGIGLDAKKSLSILKDFNQALSL